MAINAVDIKFNETFFQAIWQRLDLTGSRFPYCNFRAMTMSAAKLFTVYFLNNFIAFKNKTLMLKTSDLLSMIDETG